MAQTTEELKQEQIKFFNTIKEAFLRLNPNIFNATQGLTIDEVNTEIAKAISLIKGEGLPEDSDTLKELADKIVANSNSVNEDEVNAIIKKYLEDNPINTTVNNVEGNMFTVVSTTPSGMLETEVESLIDSKLNDKIKTLPSDVKVEYVYTPRPFFGGLAQPPVSPVIPQNSTLYSKAYNSTGDNPYTSVYHVQTVCCSENKVFAIVKYKIENGYGYEVTLVSWDIDDAGSLTNPKNEYAIRNDSTSIFNFESMTCSPDGETICFAINRNIYVYTIAYNKVNSRYEFISNATITTPKYIDSVHLTGDASELSITLADTGYGAVNYKAGMGTWSKSIEINRRTTEASNISTLISKDGKTFFNFLADSSRTTVEIYKREKITDTFTYDNTYFFYNGVLSIKEMRISGDGKVIYYNNGYGKIYGLLLDSNYLCSFIDGETYTCFGDGYSSAQNWASFDVSLDGKTIVALNTSLNNIIVYRKK